MKHIQKRGNTFYYRRRIPSSILHLADIKSINRPLSADKSLAIKLANRYDHLFNIIVAGLKLGTDINPHIIELGINHNAKIDIYQQYIGTQDVGEARLNKIERLLEVIRELLPSDVSTIDTSVLDKVRENIIGLPRRNLGQYKDLSIKKLTRMKIPQDDRLSIAGAKDYLIVLNSFMKFLYEREIIARQYSVKLMKKDTHNRAEKVALSADAVLKLISDTKRDALKSSFTLLYLTGMRPSEAHLCKLTTVDGIKCFDLRDTDIKLKTAPSYRLIPVHSSITNPKQLLEDYRSLSNRVVARGYHKVSDTGTLYSLRHSFATHLAGAGVEPHLISELLGHSHKDMTMGRYVKGLPVKMLLEVVNKL